MECGSLSSRTLEVASLGDFQDEVVAVLLRSEKRDGQGQQEDRVAGDFDGQHCCSPWYSLIGFLARNLERTDEFSSSQCLSGGFLNHAFRARRPTIYGAVPHFEVS